MRAMHGSVFTATITSPVLTDEKGKPQKLMQFQVAALDSIEAREAAEAYVRSVKSGAERGWGRDVSTSLWDTGHKVNVRQLGGKATRRILIARPVAGVPR